MYNCKMCGLFCTTLMYVPIRPAAQTILRRLSTTPSTERRKRHSLEPFQWLFDRVYICISQFIDCMVLQYRTHACTY